MVVDLKYSGIMPYYGVHPLTKLDESVLAISDSLPEGGVFIGSIIPVLFGRSRCIETISVVCVNGVPDPEDVDMKHLGEQNYSINGKPFPQVVLREPTEREVELLTSTESFGFTFDSGEEKTVDIVDPLRYIDWMNYSERSKSTCEDMYHLAKVFEKDAVCTDIQEVVSEKISEYPDHLQANQASRFESIDLWVRYIKKNEDGGWKDEQRVVIDSQIESANALVSDE